MAPVIGIDLGTVCSCVGVYQHGNVEIVANAQGDRVTPSVVAFTLNERLVGNAAKAQADQNSENTVYGKYQWLVHNILKRDRQGISNSSFNGHVRGAQGRVERCGGGGGGRGRRRRGSGLGNGKFSLIGLGSVQPGYSILMEWKTFIIVYRTRIKWLQ